VRLDATLRVLANDQEGLVVLLGKRREEHGFSAGAGRSPEEIAERFFDRRAIPDARAATRAAETLTEYLGLSSELATASEKLREFARRREVDLREVLATFSSRVEAIAARTPGIEIKFEAGFGRPLDYYTGVVFELHAEGFADPLVGGGRYDRMMEMLGASQPVPAVGFTMRLDLLSVERRP
jgi:ATP phosphoribosyltransferase regulatory subunit